MTATFEAKKKKLREQAEARLAQSVSTVENLSLEEIKTLFHDYQVYQIELELQNEELRDTQKQFEIARDRFARLYNDAPVGYLTIDHNGIIAQTNQTFAEMVEKDPYLLCGKALIDFISTLDRSAFLGRFKAFFKNPEGKELSFALSGCHRTVRCVGRIENHRQESENNRRLLLILSDITEQASMEKNLQERERFLTSILETTQDGFWVVDAGGRLTDINDAYCRMTGYTKEELEGGLRIGDLDALEDRVTTETRLARIIENGSELFETKHRRKDGSIFDVEVSASYLDLHGGMLVCFCRDISDRKSAELACRENEMRYRLLSDVTMEGIVIHKKGVIVDLNAALARLLGYEPQEILDKNILDLLVHEQDRDIVRKNIVKEYARPYVVRFVKKNGEVVFVELEARNFEINGEIRRVAAVRDISDRIKSEEEIRRVNAELRNAIAEKDMFFSIIAHDLKSPISGFLSLTKILVEDFEELTVKEVNRSLDALYASSVRIYALLENLLEWARVQQGLLTCSPSRFLLKGVVRASLDFTHSVADQKGVVLRDETPDDLIVCIDPPMIGTVLRNIISNALKFSNRGGQVRITARHDGDMVTVAVQDEGVGMDQHTLSMLFSLDNKITRPGTEGEASTGLGLILCKEFVEKHGGTIWAESSPGQGTTFYFTLPLADNTCKA
ncbi:PAS domain S-box protein [Desulfomicrobium sp. ZS1]|uniref:PAS domain-containing sensor histidine kinase n=1 Tax=Desulfomicrobium sp. ZS1 TaxID=2952228 RepID=UPI0020B2364F|nr:PAS domain S-box protein [Desulfomicrobium sp. ZS1]UTF51566.1 PAS domain S-box protein [Desulfomicrobium sp. ZS1]